MADLTKTTLDAGGGGATAALTGLTEHGAIKLMHGGAVRVEAELDDDPASWQPIYEAGGRGNAVLDYVGDKLNIVNTSGGPNAIRAGQA